MVPVCDKCLWCEQCASDEACEHFYPLDDEAYIDEMIESERLAFRKDWFAYVEQMDE